MKSNNRFLKAILSIALCACMLVGFLPVSALAATSGSCGDGVNFSISGDTLTITGNGRIMDEAAFNCWNDQEKNIKKIVIGSGVTISGNSCLSGHRNLESVVYNGTVNGITGFRAFAGKSNMSFQLLEGVGRSENAFSGCNNMRVKLVDANGNDKTDFYNITVQTNTSSTNYMTIKGNLTKGSIAPIDNVVYTGGELKPAVTVLWNGQTVGSNNYDVSYSNNVEVGTATVTITGKGNYQGTLTQTFQIVPDYLDVKPVGIDKTYTGSSVSLIQPAVLNAEYSGYSVEYARGSETEAPVSEWSSGVPFDIDAGTYYIWYRVLNGGNVLVTYKTPAVAIIRPYDASSGNVIFDKYEFDYNGAVQRPFVKVECEDFGTLAANTDYVVEYSDAGIDAGEKTVTVKFKGNFVGEITESYKINKIDPVVTVPEGLTSVYGKLLSDVTLPDGWSWVDSSMSVGNVGTQTFTAIYTPADTKNYNFLETELTVTVLKADPDCEYPDYLEGTYGDLLGTVELPEGWNWENENLKLDDDDYHKAVYTPEDTGNYNIIEVEFYVFVNRATPTAEDFDIKLPESLYFDGYSKRVYAYAKAHIVGMGSVSVYHYDEDGYGESYPTEPGKYTFELKVSQGSNYTGATISHEDWAFEIIYLPVEDGMYEIKDHAYLGDGIYWFTEGSIATVVPSEGYAVAIEEYGMEDKVEFTAESEKKFFVTRIDDFAMTDYIDVSDVIKYDDADPTGSIEISENKWNDLADEITFDMFFNKKQEIVINAFDEESGVGGVLYYISDEAVDAADLEDLAWEAYDSENKPVVEADGIYVVYAKIIDNVGHTVYLSSDGFIIDTTAPVIGGVKDGDVLCKTVKVTVDDAYLDTVTVNGEAAEAEIGLRGNKDSEYIVIASDEAGNVTTVKVTMKPISSIAEGIEGLTEENVTTEDETAVSEVIKAGEELLKGEFIDKNEKKIIEEIIAEAKALEKRIAEIKAEEESGGNEGGTNDGAQGEDPKPKPEDKPEDNKPEAGPVTGEGNKMLIFAVIMAVCAAAICVVAIMRKKEMNK